MGGRRRTSCSSWPRRWRVPGRPAARRAARDATCSGGDSGARRRRRGASSASSCRRSRRRRSRALRASVLPAAATVGNPLDYTALIWGERERCARDRRRSSAPTRRRPACSCFYDDPPGSTARSTRAGRRSSTRIRDGAAREPGAGARRLDAARAARRRGRRPLRRGGIARGRRPAHRRCACAAALAAPPPDAGARSREMARRAAAPTDRARPRGARGSPSTRPRRCCARAGVPVVDGPRSSTTRTTPSPRWRELGGPVALKLSGPTLRHKSEPGALVLGRRAADAVRAAYARLARRGRGAAVLVERMARARRRAARRPCARDAVVPGARRRARRRLDRGARRRRASSRCPPTPARVEHALAQLRGAPLLTGAAPSRRRRRRGAARRRAGELLLEPASS